MSLYDFPPALSGQTLWEAVDNDMPNIDPMASGFIYEPSIILISSDPGLGKSVISTQVALELSQGLPVFGGLEVPHPFRVWYLVMERNRWEPLSRMKEMKEALPIDINNSNLFIDDELQEIDFMSTKTIEYVVERGLEYNPDLIILDPMYGVLLDTVTGEKVSTFCKFMTIVKKKLGCAIYYNHHTSREVIDKEGNSNKRKDPFYGSQFLKAHVTSSYTLESVKENQVKLRCQKDSHSNLMGNIILNYDPETYLCTLDKSQASGKERVKLFCNSMFYLKKAFTFAEIKASTGVSRSQLRKLLSDTPFLTALCKSKSLGDNTLYDIKRLL